MEIVFIECITGFYHYHVHSELHTFVMVLSTYFHYISNFIPRITCLNLNICMCRFMFNVLSICEVKAVCTYLYIFVLVSYVSAFCYVTKIVCSHQGHDYLWASYQIRKIAGCTCAGNAGNVFPPPRVTDPDMNHDTCVTHEPCCMMGSSTSGFLWRPWRGKRSRHCWWMRMRNSQFTYLIRGPLGMRNCF